MASKKTLNESNLVALGAKYPLAATLVLRAMVDFSLTRAKSST
jgi:hypothetical protein